MGTNSNRGRLQSGKTEKIEIQIWGTAKKYNSAAKKITKIYSSQIEKGKKLTFISQELGREINTIGSKSNNLPMQKAVVEMKNELEKIKEQLLNVL